jgi:glycosyltransferase involved in cell wall biosynthesis
MSAPEVSVVVPTRNRRARLALALRTALRQRSVDLEVVVVDDASSDGTDAAVAAIGDPRVRYVTRDARGGVGAARNDGIAVAAGGWVAFLDDDDLWAPDKLRLQLAALRSQRAPWAYAGDVVVDADLRVVGGAPPAGPDEVVRVLGRYNAVPAGASNVVVASDVLRRVGGFDTALSTSEDWDLWLRLAGAGRPACVDLPLVAVGIHGGNASRDSEAMLAEIEVIRRRHGVPVDRARHLRWAAWTAVLERRRRDAARYYLRAAAAGDLPSLVRAAAAVVTPGRVVRRSRVRSAASASWVAAAETWLAEVATWRDTSTPA